MSSRVPSRCAFGSAHRRGLLGIARLGRTLVVFLIAPPSRAYEYFWLDSFCIRQAVGHADLRSKAIESMNFIYAAASHTFVFIKGVQALDAGRRPASLAHGGRPIYFSPRDENLRDVVAYIYALNWMGRVWI